MVLQRKVTAIGTAVRGNQFVCRIIERTVTGWSFRHVDELEVPFLLKNEILYSIMSLWASSPSAWLTDSKP